MATTFCDTTSARLTLAVALSFAGMANRGSGLPASAALEDLAEGMARAGEKLVGMRRVDGDGKLAALGCHPLPGRPGSSPAETGPGPVRSQGMSMFFGLRMLTVPMAPCALQERGPLGRRLHVRGQRSGNRRRCPGEIHHQLAADVQAGEVVVMGLGDRQAITGEHQLGLDRRGRIDTQADDRVAAQGQGLGPGRSLISERLEWSSSISREINRTG